MAGTKEGAAKARQTILARDPDFYSNIGRVGGKNSTTGGFASITISEDGTTGHDRARASGSIGGKISKRAAPMRFMYEGEFLSLMEIAEIRGVCYQTARMYALDNSLERQSCTS